MLQYKLHYTIEKVLQDAPTREQKILRELTGRLLPRAEAANVWRRVQDHKWYLGERLRRDVGWRVAAVDYLENFYAPVAPRENNRGTNAKVRSSSRSLRPTTFAA